MSSDTPTGGQAADTAPTREEPHSILARMIDAEVGTVDGITIVPSMSLAERMRQISDEFRTAYGLVHPEGQSAIDRGLYDPLALQPDPALPLTALDPVDLAATMHRGQVVLAKVWPLHPSFAPDAAEFVLVRRTKAGDYKTSAFRPAEDSSDRHGAVVEGYSPMEAGLDAARMALGRGSMRSDDFRERLIQHHGLSGVARFEPLDLNATLREWRRLRPRTLVSYFASLGRAYGHIVGVADRAYGLRSRLLTATRVTGTGKPHSVFDPASVLSPWQRDAQMATVLRDRTQRETLTGNVRDALRALRAGSPFDELESSDGTKTEVQDLLSDALRDIAAAFNDWLRFDARVEIADLLQTAAEQSPWESSARPIKKLGCGHWVASNYDDWNTDYHGTTFCEGCLDDGNWVHAVDVDDYIPQGQAYVNEDGDYVYRDPEPEDDDDDDDGLMNWGTNGDAYLAHDKSFTPSPLGDFTMGIELESEVTSRRYRKDAVEECEDYFNSGDKLGTYAIFKADGSLDEDCGFEIVTAARRLEGHLAKFKSWEPHDSMRAWDAESCGMHVHIDSRAFSQLTLGKFMMFMNDHANAKFIRSIAGRHPKMDSQAERYARTIDQQFVADPLKAKDGYASNDRYRVVNLTNLSGDEQIRLQCYVDRNSKGDYSTVEVRIFRATLRKSRLLAQIEFAHAAVMFARVASWHNLTGPAFLDWLRTTQCYPNLSRWFGVAKARNAKADAEVKEAAEV